MASPSPVRVAIDIETTGLQVETESIIEIGAIKFRGDAIIESFETLIEPRRPLPYRIQRLTNITPGMLIGAPSFATIAPRLRTFLGDLPLVGHSVGFDASFLRKMHIAERNALIDTFELASLLLPNLTSYSLENVAAHLNLSAPVHHRALADAILARDVLLALEARIAALTDPALTALCDLATPAEIPGLALLRRERQARGLSAAPGAMGGNSTLGAALNAQLRLNPSVLGTHVATLGDATPKPILAQTITPTNDASAVTDFVTEALQNGEQAIIELANAGTGLDAALVPALQWALGQQKRLVIAAATMQAARQVQQQHLPRALAQIAPDASIPTALLFETQDYLCLHRWYGPAREVADLAPDGVRGLAKLTLWMHTTATGARDEITLGPTEQIAWDAVRAGPRFVEQAGCAYRDRGWCFARRAQTAARDAQVVITTHAALFGNNSVAGADAGAYVPSGDGYVVLDAHHLAERVIAHATNSMELEALVSGMGMLWRTGAHGATGLLARAAQVIPGGGEQNWQNQVQKAQDAARTFFGALPPLLAEGQSHARNAPNEGVTNSMRLDATARSLSHWGTFTETWFALEKRCNALADSATQAARKVEKVRGAESLALELLASSQWLRQVVQWGHAAVAQPNDDGAIVYWVRPPQPSYRPGSKTQPGADLPTVHGAPAHAAQIVGPALQRMQAGLVLAGTALAVEGHFAEWMEQLGTAPTARAISVPVDYAGQTIVLIPSDAPEPNMPAFQRSLTETLAQVATTLGGRTVALFASHTALRTTAAALKPLLESQDILVLAQGIDGSLRQLWNNYRSQERIVLLGAGGMWDGWESDGARVGCLFVPRIPLAALSDPLLAARAENYANPMRQFLVPQAALRVRQALNRLAWDHAERNAVILYDSRILTKDYGATILNTLPPVTLREESMTMLGMHVRDWLAGSAE